MTTSQPLQPIIHVVDDDESVRRSLVRLLTSSGCQALAHASAAEFRKHAATDAAGCIILDVRMPGMDGMTLQQELAATGCTLPIIFLTGHGDIPMSVEAMKQGAEDFLIKPVDEELLLTTVERALKHNRQRRLQLEEETTIRSRADRLTAREFEVMRCLLTGALNKQIAAHLGIVEKTVKVHRARVQEKMGVRSIAELVRLCERISVKPDPM